MNYIALTKCEVANGSGCRVALWVSGCPHHCSGCHNPETWDYKSGKEFGPTELDAIAKELQKPYYKGITITGGDPLCKKNIPDVTLLIKKIKENFPNKTIWVYTGEIFEDIMTCNAMRYIDVLVDGPFIQNQRDITLAFRGSKNQRVIDVQKSLAAGEVVLYEEV